MSSAWYTEETTKIFARGIFDSFLLMDGQKKGNHTGVASPITAR